MAECHQTFKMYFVVKSLCVFNIFLSVYTYLLISWPVEAGILVALCQPKQEVQAEAKIYTV